MKKGVFKMERRGGAKSQGKNELDVLTHRKGRVAPVSEGRREGSRKSLVQ